MILSLIAILLVAGIAYFHFVQGLFSAAISMALAILAATLAVGLHESLATSLLGGAMADYANAMMTCVIFAAVYGVGRIVFDSLIPGNVSLPFYMDKVGGLVCGVIAGIFAAGTVVLAAQMMPVGATVVTFNRYPLAETKETAMPTARRSVDTQIEGALEIEANASRPPETARQNLMLGVDSMVLNYAAWQSKAGSLAGAIDFNAIHPSLLDELFFGRVGIEPGAKHSALNGIAGKKEVSVAKLFAVAQLNQLDSEIPEVRHPAFNVAKQVKSDANKVLLVVRTKVDVNATDKDKKFRFSPGSIRLVAGGKDHYPIGTLDHPGNLLMANRIDDYLVAEAGGGAEIDFVFELDRSTILADAAAKADLKAIDAAFIEVKRYGRVDLSGMDIATTLDSPESTGVMRKDRVREAINKRISGSALEGQ